LQAQGTGYRGQVPRRAKAKQKSKSKRKKSKIPGVATLGFCFPPLPFDY
jgi:hypothetical protein